jgi:hypothetical protein
MLWRLLLACLIVGLPASAASAQASPGEPLPPFRMDSDLAPQIVLNPQQGLGQCHWLDSQILSSPIVGWAYDASAASSGWRALEPEDGAFNWAPLDGQVLRARNLGKHIWLELLTTEGSVPQWAQNAGVPLVGSRGGTPVPWDAEYQSLLRRAVHAMAARYDNDPTVDAINLMAGGCYGEMSICAPQADRRAWEAAGYTDARFIEAVKQIVDIYLEPEHTWEDGHTTHGFLNTPVVLQLGSGLYGHTTAVIRPVVEYAMSKYGMRVWLKYNGWGGNHDMGWLFREYASITRVGYEPAGNSQDFLSRPGDFVQAALDQHAHFLCLQKTYFDIASPEWQEARELAARYLGAQIVLRGVRAPEAAQSGQEYTVGTDWANRGTAPLMRPERQGIKDVPASYDVVIAFVHPANGATEWAHTFRPAVPTTQWHSAEPVSLETRFLIPDSLPGGEYELRIGLADPNLPAQDEQRYFRLINIDLHDGSGRYTVASTTISSQSAVAPAATAAPEPTPKPGQNPGAAAGNWLSRLLNSLWEWLSRIFSGLQYFGAAQRISRVG